MIKQKIITGVLPFNPTIEDDIKSWLDDKCDGAYYDIYSHTTKRIISHFVTSLASIQDKDSVHLVALINFEIED